MLGKGIESLIPNKRQGAQGDAGSPPALPADPNEEPFMLHEHSDTELELPPATPSPSLSAPESAAPIIPKSEPQESPLPSPPAQAVPARRAPAASAPPVADRSRAAPRVDQAVFQIEVEKVAPNPHQPRRHFDEEGLKDLALSIRQFGILQPIVVTKIEREVPTGTDVSYELVAGERRLMAAKMLGQERVPAIIRPIDIERERLELAIIENLQREDLNAIEMARAFARLQDEFRLTQREIASRLGKSREVVANTVRLLDLPPFIQEGIAKGQITESHGRLLLAIDDPKAQEKLFRDLLDRHMTTRELKGKVRRARAPHEADGDGALSPDVAILQERLSSELGTPVKISSAGEGGKITISFYSKEELDAILKRLGTEAEG